MIYKQEHYLRSLSRIKENNWASRKWVLVYSYPDSIYLLKGNNRNTSTRWEIR